MTLTTLIVTKSRSKHDDNDKGWLTPIFSIDDDENITNIPSNDYVNGIFISKGYADIDSKYNENELFILDKHMLDEQRTNERGLNQYFSMGHFANSLIPNTLIPIINSKLPPREYGLLPIETTPPNGIFFIMDEKEQVLSGPLTATKEDERYRVLPKKVTSIRGLNNDSVAVYTLTELQPIILTTEIVNQSYLPSLKALSNYPYKQYDYISDDRLVTYFGNLEIGKNAKLLARREAQKLRDGLNKQRKSNLVPSERLSRLESVLDQYLNSTDIGNDLVNDFLKNTDEGKVFLTNYVSENQGNLLREHIAHIRTEAEREEKELKLQQELLEKQLQELTSELSHLKESVSLEKGKAQDDIREIRNRLQEESQKEIQEAKSRTDEEVKRFFAESQQQKQEEIAELEANIVELKEKQSIEEGQLENTKNDLENLIDVQQLQQEKKFLEREKKVLDRAVEAHEEILKDPVKLARSMSEVKLVNDILNGRKLTSSPSFEHVLPIELDKNQPSSANELIEKISASLEQDSGKTFSNDEIANIMICLTQSFLSILSGPPGIGKTSTVIRLAQALNLGEVDGTQNFIYIPVGRGWVSSRDILGFYNSLKDMYQPARTGLYEFLQRNSINTYNDAPRIVLLDEANLSSMEHYWSDFLGMCDNEGRFRNIDTGHPERSKGLLNVAKNIRFIATINNDATTERLSPRLIDRAPIITLDQNSDQSQSIVELQYLHGSLSYEVLEKLFMPAQEDSINSSDDEKLKQILAVLSEIDSSLGQPIHISPRKELAIRNYCAVASKIMETEESLDFAIAQHVLPHIEGFGSNFKARLEKLREELGNQYPRSKRILERILSSGSDFTNSYSFF